MCDIFWLLFMCVTFCFCSIKAFVACAAILLLLMVNQYATFSLFCKFMKEFTINLTDLYSPNNSAPYNQVF